MSMKVYKLGQGYWTRLMTALGAGVLTLAGVAWILQNMRNVPGLASSKYLVFAQSGVATVLIAILGYWIYRLTYVNARTSDFMISTEGEMRKVNWPARREVMGATWVVIITMIVITLIVLGADLVFNTLFDWMLN